MGRQYFFTFMLIRTHVRTYAQSTSQDTVLIFDWDDTAGRPEAEPKGSVSEP